eukprot:1024577-Rhodomonas_salina.1
MKSNHTIQHPSQGTYLPALSQCALSSRCHAEQLRLSLPPTPHLPSPKSNSCQTIAHTHRCRASCRHSRRQPRGDALTTWRSSCPETRSSSFPPSNSHSTSPSTRSVSESPPHRLPLAN